MLELSLAPRDDVARESESYLPARGDIDRRADMARRVAFECDLRGVPLPLEYAGSVYPRRVKPAFDIVMAFAMLVFLLPLLLVVALAIKLGDGGPVFFVQQRTGYLGCRFRLYKFRTMVPEAETLKEALRPFSIHGAASPDFKVIADPRVTPIGRILRRTSIDELPNLLNILRGEMSFVGPRPTSFSATTYSAHHLPRLAARPGLTGLWQVSGRANVDFDERAALDTAYVRTLSLRTDLRLIVRTLGAVGRADGAH